MKRTGQIKRKKAMARTRSALMRMSPSKMIDEAKTLAEVHAAMELSSWQSRERKARKSLRRVGSRSSREKADIVAFRERLMDRAGGVCERCGCPAKNGLEPHHLVPRSRCVGWPLRHHPEVNGAAVDFYCHRALDLDPHDVGGPLEHEARRAFQEFGRWRNGSAGFSVDGVQGSPYPSR